MDGLSAFRFAVGVMFLTYASFKDLKTRRVPDWVWVGFGTIALIVFEVELFLKEAKLEHQLILVPTCILFYTVFFGKEMWTEEGFKLRPLRLGLYILALIVLIYSTYHFWRVGGDDANLYWSHLSMPVLIVLAHVFYQFGLLRGGADAKAFMSIALLVPIYPNLDPSLPLAQLPPSVQNAVNITFPFAFVVLLDAALLLLILPVGLFFINTIRGDLHGIEAILGYRVRLDRLPKFAWLMDRIEEGEHIRVLFPRRSENREEQIQKLEEKGFKHVWVTPQIPFIVPMTIGFIMAFLVGNFIIGLVLLIT